MWYIEGLRNLGWTPNGINLIMVGIKKLFEFCNIRGYKVLDENLIPLPEKEYNIPRVANIESFNKVFKQIPNNNNAYNVRNRAILKMLWDTGARSGEICSLNQSDIDLKKHMSIIRTEKNRGRRPIRQIFWTDETNCLLKKWIDKLMSLKEKFTFKDDDALFITIASCPKQPIRGKRISPYNVAELLRYLSNKAHLPTVNAHSFRHAMGRDIIQACKNSASVSNILGHSHLDSSYVYTMLFGEELKNEWSKVIRRRK